mmetsp:Transcript_13842/g.32197  ORF Transcript_13842/g.32197 Transcript_13842/m.32197 type:complete len:132 (+) Transcript_13842:67-462(+)
MPMILHRNNNRFQPRKKQKTLQEGGSTCGTPQSTPDRSAPTSFRQTTHENLALSSSKMANSRIHTTTTNMSSAFSSTGMFASSGSLEDEWGHFVGVSDRSMTRDQDSYQNLQGYAFGSVGHNHTTGFRKIG